jgi:hypothetical protein
MEEILCVDEHFWAPFRWLWLGRLRLLRLVLLALRGRMRS